MMKKLSYIISIILGYYLLMLLGSCGKEGAELSPLSEIERNGWIISGKVANAGFEFGEVSAIGIDGSKYRSVIDQDRNFGIELPGNSTYAIYFVKEKPYGAESSHISEFILAPSSDSNKKAPPALLQLEESSDVGLRDTIRLPVTKNGSQLDLGEIDIKGKFAFATINPSTILDFDNDGLTDFTDFDDQNDGLPDNIQREELESIQICHFSENKDTGEISGKRAKISLSALYDHLEHGDNLGHCLAPQVSK